MTERLILDASIAAKWFLKDEADTDLAEDILIALLAEEIEVHAPHIFLHEVSGLLTKACLTRTSARLPRIEKDKAIECIRELLKLPILISETIEDEYTESLALAVSYSKGYYDMVYLRLAMKMACNWYTADTKLLQACPPDFPRDTVVLLSSLRDAP